MEKVVATPIYLDWAFWAVVVSVMAIILSQLPPIHLLLKSARISVEAYSKIAITHKVGNPNLQLHVLISNTGGRKLRIRAIRAELQRDGAQVAVLPAQNFLQEPNDKNPVIFTTFQLAPEDDWGHIVNFLNFFNRDDEREYRKLEWHLKEDIFAKRALIEGELQELIEAEADNFEPLLAFFEQRNIWRAGDYRLTVTVETDQPKANVSRTYRFTLFESSELELRAVTNQYRYGAGIYWDSPRPTSIVLDISEA